MTYDEQRRAELFQAARRLSMMGGLFAVTRVWERLDYSQLSGPGRQLRVLSAGNGATEADIGRFWWTDGYSVIGGGDVMPES